MNSTFRFWTLVWCVALLAGGCALADTVTYNFNSNSLPSGLSFVGSPGFGLSFSNGQAVVTKDAGYDGGFGSILADAWGIGDWTVQVNATRTDHCCGSSGLVGSVGQQWLSGTLPYLSHSDVYFLGDTLILSNIFPYSLPSSAYIPNDDTTVTFQITRVGDTITTYFDAGSGWVQAFQQSGPDLLGPTNFALFAGMEDGDTGYQEVHFDNFTVTADSFEPKVVPEPASLILLGTGMGAAFACRRPRR